MKTKTDLERNITSITNTIHREFPELSKYIIEIPSKESEKEDINIKDLEDYYYSLEGLVNKYAKTHIGKIVTKDMGFPVFPEYSPYPPSEDIYQQYKEEVNLNPEEPLSKIKTLNEDEETLNEKSFKDDMSGDDLDVPGSELDDQQESLGSEDEENNYYSLGGDNHNDLEEDNG